MVRLIDRRSFLAAGATAGVVTIAGCAQDSGTETENGTNNSSGSDGPDDSTDSAGDGAPSGDSGSNEFAVNECPIIPGTYTTFDPANGPLPFSFEYPEVIDETPTPMDYASKETQTLVTGEFRRKEDLPAEGDVFMDANVNLNPQQPRDTWYENRSDRDTLLTTTINGSEVRFIATTPDIAFDEDREGYSAVGLAPYDWGSTRDSPTATRESYHEVTMGILLSLGDDKDISSSCAANLRTTLENGVESIEMRSDVELFEERV